MSSSSLHRDPLRNNQEGVLHPTRLLCVGANKNVVSSQCAVFAKAGYRAQCAVLPEDIQRSLHAGDFDILVLNHTLSQAERDKLALQTKQADPSKLVFVLHASGARESTHVDAAVDSRKGVPVMIEILSFLEGLLHTRRHDHPELTKAEGNGDCIVAVDPDRHYIFATDAAC